MHRIELVLAALLVAAGPIFAQPNPPAPPAPPAPPSDDQLRLPRGARVARISVNSPATSFLGVGVTDIDAERTKALHLKEEHGVEVTSVDADSPAAKAGIKVSDVVLEYNGERVEGIEQFLRLVHETPVGRQVKLLISRNGSTQTLTATTGSRSVKEFNWIGSMEDFKQFKMPQIHIFPDTPHTMMMWQSRTLGVETEQLNSQLGEYFGAKDGVLVRSVIKGSAAEKAGLKAGDVIVKIGNQKVTSSREISNALRSLSSTKAFPVTIVRDRKEMTVSATIEEKSSEERRGTVVRMDL
jgi:serine protease Do